MTVLVGGLCVPETNFNQSKHGVFIKKTGSFSNDFFVKLLDFVTKWNVAPDTQDAFEGSDRKTGKLK
jgi:catalase-peroxidase